MEHIIIKTSNLSKDEPISQTIEKYSSKGFEEFASSQNLEVAYQAQLIDSEILVTGTLKGRVTLLCYLCNEPFEHPVDIAIVQSYPSTTEKIDLDEEIRQLLILNLPVKPLCKADCLGLCPQCGKNLNKEKCKCAPKPISDRWEKLKDLLKK